MRNKEHISLKVGDIQEIFEMTPPVVSATMSIHDVLSIIINYTETGCVYVEDNVGKLIGCIRPHSILNFCFPFEAMLWREEFSGFMELVNKDSLESIIDRDTHQITDDDDVSSVITVMAKEKLMEVPVVNGDGELTGRISLPSLVQLYLKNTE